MNKPFPFWSLALSIATGILISNAVTWFVVETRLRYELREAGRQLQAETQRLEREATIREQARQAETFRKQEMRRQADAREDAAQAAAAKAEADRLDDFRRQADRDRREGEYFRAATDGLPVGTFACKDRQIVKRTDTGWTVTVKGDGSPARCRTEP